MDQIMSKSNSYTHSFLFHIEWSFLLHILLIYKFRQREIKEPYLSTDYLKTIWIKTINCKPKYFSYLSDYLKATFKVRVVKDTKVISLVYSYGFSGGKNIFIAIYCWFSRLSINALSKVRMRDFPSLISRKSQNVRIALFLSSVFLIFIQS